MSIEVTSVSIQEIINLDELRLLFAEPSKDEYEKVALTDIGVIVIGLAVEFCILSGNTPDCAVNGDGSAASSDIISLSQLELKDLIRKLNLIHSLNAKAFDPSRN